MKGWRHRCRSSSVGLCAALVVGVAPGALAAEVAEPAATGSQWMVDYLQRIARTTDPVVDVYMNRARAAGISTLLGQPLSPMKELQLRVKIAQELLRGGQTRAAIEMYQHVWNQIEKRGLPVREDGPCASPVRSIKHTIRE